jgi:hypothetical protein
MENTTDGRKAVRCIFSFKNKNAAQGAGHSRTAFTA